MLWGTSPKLNDCNDKKIPFKSGKCFRSSSSFQSNVFLWPCTEEFLMTLEDSVPQPSKHCSGALHTAWLPLVTRTLGALRELTLPDRKPRLDELLWRETAHRDIRSERNTSLCHLKVILQRGPKRWTLNLSTHLVIYSGWVLAGESGTAFGVWSRLVEPLIKNTSYVPLNRKRGKLLFKRLQSN